MLEALGDQVVGEKTRDFPQERQLQRTVRPVPHETVEMQWRMVHFSGHVDELSCTAVPSDKKGLINAMRQIR